MKHSKKTRKELSLAVKVSGVLLVCIAVIITIKECFAFPNLSDYLSGTATETIGIIITILFVQRLFDRKNEQDAIAAEAKALLRSNTVMSLYLSQYKDFFFCVTTPIEKRSVIPHNMPVEFTLKDMRQLHQSCGMVKYGILKPSVDGFLEIELIIRDYIVSILKEINFDYHHEIEKILLEYIDVSLRYESRSALMLEKTTTLGGKPAVDSVPKMLEDHADKFYQELLSGKHMIANAMHPYAFLYMLMNQERDILLRYSEEIQKIQLAVAQK